MLGIPLRSAALLLASGSLSFAQFYVFSTVAGSGRPVFSSGGPATSARLIQPTGVAADADGNFYISDTYYNQIFRVSAEGTISVFAGSGIPGFGGDGGPATAAAVRLFNPNDMAIDSAGSLYFADTINNRVRKITRAGIISTVAGNGLGGVAGNNGPATAAAIGQPWGVAIDAAGNLFISQVSDQVVRRVTPDGTITTFAGNGESGFSGDNGPATQAMLSHPEGLRTDSSGNLYIADNYNHRIRRVAQGVITTFAGNGTSAYAGDGGRAAQASLFYPTDIAFDSSGNAFIADATNTRIRRVDTGGFISTFAGGGSLFTDGAAAQAQLFVPTALAFDRNGNLLIPLVYLKVVRSVTAGQTIRTVAGSVLAPAPGDGGPATRASLLSPLSVATDTGGNVFFSDEFDNRIRKVDRQGIITTAAGNGVFGYSGDNGPATGAMLGSPRAMTSDTQGNVYVTTPVGARVRRVSTNGTITLYAGDGQVGFSGDGTRATQASLNVPIGLNVDAQGNLYISDAGSARIRRVDSAGIINSIAGTGTEGFSGDNGLARDARIYQPRQIATDKNGNIYFADSLNNRVRRITPAGIISTVAGNGEAGSAGDGGPATSARLDGPHGLAIDDAGNLFISTANRIHKVNTAGIITTIAGFPGGAADPEGALGTQADLTNPGQIAVDSAGVVYVADSDAQRVRALTPVPIVREGVLNGATLTGGGVAPGEIVTVFIGPGVALGPAAGAGLRINDVGRVDNILAGVQVLFDDLPAPLIFVNGTQVNAIVPYSVGNRQTTVMHLIINGRPTNKVTLPVVEASPGVFAITNSNGSVNTASNPTTDRVLVIYGTGEGRGTPVVNDGTVNASVFPKPVLPVTVTIGGQDAVVQYAGAAPGFVAGVLQINVVVPPGVNGTVPLQIKIGTAVTPPGLTISVR